VVANIYNAEHNLRVLKSVPGSARERPNECNMAQRNAGATVFAMPQQHPHLPARS